MHKDCIVAAVTYEQERTQFKPGGVTFNRYINDTAAYVRSSEKRGENTVQRSDECKLASREASKYQINSGANAKPRRFNYWYLAATRDTTERRKGIFVVFLFHSAMLFHPEIFVGKTVSVISVRLSRVGRNLLNAAAWKLIFETDSLISAA